MTKTGKITKILGLEVLKIAWITDQYKGMHYHAWQCTIFKLFMFSMGYSTANGDSIIIRIGLTKLELFFSFTIKDRWTR
mgnify:CR=1 FL=1